VGSKCNLWSLCFKQYVFRSTECKIVSPQRRSRSMHIVVYHNTQKSFSCCSHGTSIFGGDTSNKFQEIEQWWLARLAGNPNDYTRPTTTRHIVDYEIAMVTSKESRWDSIAGVLLNLVWSQADKGVSPPISQLAQRKETLIMLLVYLDFSSLSSLWGDMVLNMPLIVKTGREYQILSCRYVKGLSSAVLGLKPPHFRTCRHGVHVATEFSCLNYLKMAMKEPRHVKGGFLRVVTVIWWAF